MNLHAADARSAAGDVSGLRHRLASALSAPDVLDALRRRPDACALLGGGRPTSCTVERVHFGSRLGIVLEYLVAWAGAPSSTRLFGQLPTEAPGEAVAAIRRKLDRGRPASLPLRARPWPVVLLAEIGLILRAPGSDERLDGLWLTEAGRRPAPSRCEGLATAAATCEPAELLAHRLGKRAVLRLHAVGGAGGDAILKLYKRGSGQGARAAAIHRQLAEQGFDRGSVRVPLARSDAQIQDGFCMQAVEGLMLGERAARDGAPIYAWAGLALARLHAAQLSGLADYGIADEVDLLQRWVEFMRLAAPQMAGDFAEGLRGVEAAFAGSQPFTPAPIHRDFHEKQLIAGDDTVTLMDFDTARRGDPAQDLGNFLAHLDLAGLASDRSMDDAEAVFREGYFSLPSASPVSEKNVAIHRRATRLRLALIHACATRHEELAHRLLQGVTSS